MSDVEGPLVLLPVSGKGVLAHVDGRGLLHRVDQEIADCRFGGGGGGEGCVRGGYTACALLPRNNYAYAIISSAFFFMQLHACILVSCYYNYVLDSLFLRNGGGSVTM